VQITIKSQKTNHQHMKIMMMKLERRFVNYEIKNPMKTQTQQNQTHKKILLGLRKSQTCLLKVQSTR